MLRAVCCFDLCLLQGRKSHCHQRRCRERSERSTAWGLFTTPHPPFKSEKIRDILKHSIGIFWDLFIPPMISTMKLGKALHRPLPRPALNVAEKALKALKLSSLQDLRNISQLGYWVVPSFFCKTCFWVSRCFKDPKTLMPRFRF